MVVPTSVIAEAAAAAHEAITGRGKKVKPRKGRLRLYAFATFAVYLVFAILIGVALYSWIRYALGQFSPSDTQFLAAESTLLLAAAAILVIVFEMEKARRPRPSASRKKAQPKGEAPEEPPGQQHR